VNTPLYFLSVKILFANTKKTEYQLNNDVTIMSFCFVIKSAAEELKSALVKISDELSQCTICKSSLVNFRK